VVVRFESLFQGFCDLRFVFNDEYPHRTTLKVSPLNARSEIRQNPFIG
jgi:hypothetical protein